MMISIIKTGKPINLDIIGTYIVNNSMICLILSFYLCGCHENTAKPFPYIDPKCAPLIVNGYVRRGDLIFKRETARAIGKAIIDDMNSPENKKRSGGAAVIDLGRTWKIVEYLRKGVYGGGAVFQINKCAGTITNLHIFLD